MIRRIYFCAVLATVLVIPAQAKPQVADIDKQIQAGQYRQALSQLAELPAQQREAPRYRFLRARALAADGRLGEAITQYQALIKAQPDLPEPYNNLAVIYMRQGKIDQARVLLNQAMNTDPAYARVYKNLTTVNAARARDAYAKALQLPARGESSVLEVARHLSLPEPAPVVASVRPAPPPVTAVAKADSKPAMVYQAKSAQADKKTEPVANGAAAADGTGLREASAVLQAWAKAWSAKNADEYIGFYSDTYSPPGMSRRQWVAQRRTRIGRPKWIRVELHNIKLAAADGQRLRIRLEQAYAADNYSDVTRKEFVLQKTAGQWRIIKERGLGLVTR